MIKTKFLDKVGLSSLKQQSFQGTIVSRKRNSAIIDIKRGIWIYFFLLIFEGALRKWFLPFLAGPLLIVRDPVALYLILKAQRNNLIEFNIYIVSIVSIGIIGVFTAIFFGHGNILVALYGARILLLYFPLMFIIGRVFNKEDVINIGKVLLLMAGPMAILIMMQFHSPQTAWVNRGVGGDMTGGAGGAGALGFLRPPGTFSFPTGTISFFSMVACYVCYFWLNRTEINKYLLIAATIALVLSIPYSISRSLTFQIGITIFFMLIVISRKPENLGRLIGAIVGVGIILLIISQTTYFKVATSALTERFTTADDAEGGLKGVLVDRFLGGLVGALSKSYNEPFFGYGIGMGTNVGAKLLSAKDVFLISEGEWGRLVGEMGALLGITIILIRFSLTLRFGFSSYKKLLTGDLLPWMLYSYGCLTILEGTWNQPTSLGFSTFIGGLLFAVTKNTKKRPVQANHVPIAVD